MKILFSIGTEPHPDLLYYALLNRKIERARFLIQHGLTIDAADRYRRTPLLSSVLVSWIPPYAKHEELTVKFLLTHGANPNARNNGPSPLALAVKNNNLRIIKLLVEYGAHVNYADKSGDTPLHIVVHDTCVGLHIGRCDYHIQINLSIIRYLLENGADMYARNNEQITPYSLALQSGNSELVELFEHYDTEQLNKEISAGECIIL